MDEWSIIGVTAIVFWLEFAVHPDHLEAIVYLAFWFAIQFFSGTVSLLAPVNMGGVAWWAHIGGFAPVLCSAAFS